MNGEFTLSIEKLMKRLVIGFNCEKLGRKGFDIDSNNVKTIETGLLESDWNTWFEPET